MTSDKNSEHFFKFMYFNFTLQYCIGFAIHWHESATGVHEFPILNPSPTSLPISSYLGSKITAGGDCSCEIKRRLFLGRRVMTNLDSILKSRDTILPTKVHLVKAMVFLFFFLSLFLIYVFFYFTLQYCIGFAIHWHEFATGIHEFPILNPTPLPLSPYHLSGLSQCTSPRNPVSCIKPRLAIRFLHDSINVSMPFSQIIPPSPSPSESKSPLYTSVSFFLSCIQGGHCHLPKFHKLRSRNS